MLPYQHLIHPLLIAEMLLILPILAFGMIRRRQQAKRQATAALAGWLQAFGLGAVATLFAVNAFLIHENSRASMAYLAHMREQQQNAERAAVTNRPRGVAVPPRLPVPAEVPGSTSAQQPGGVQ